MPKAATKRINVTFPVQLLEDLDRYAPPRKRNRVIVAATEKYV
jgi:metal-responsive CopG/Arc/MetJ family transcriptional regulator